MRKSLYFRMNGNFIGYQGFSLVEVLISVACIGVLAAIWMRFMKGSVDMMSDVQNRQRVVGIEHYLLGFSDCDKTKLDPDFLTACASNSPINVLDQFGNTVISNTGRIFGSGVNAIKVTNTCQDGTINFTAELKGATSKTLSLYGGIPWYCPTNQFAKQCVRVVDSVCPVNYAALAMQDGYGGGITYSHEFQCCPVPMNLLTNDHMWSTNGCNKTTDRVVTGVRIAAAPSKNRELRCTKIDTDLYSLEASKTSEFFESPPYDSKSGWGTAAKRKIGESTKLSIPQKFFLMKMNNLDTDPFYPGTLTINDITSSAFPSVCISPNGNGIFTGRTSKYCGTHTTKQVILKSVSAPVQLFPTGCTGTFSTLDRTVTMSHVTCTTFPYFWSTTPHLRKP